MRLEGVYEESEEDVREMNLRMLREVSSALTYLGDDEARKLQDPVYSAICQPVLNLMTSREARKLHDRLESMKDDELDEFLEEYQSINDEWVAAQRHDAEYDVHKFISSVEGEIGKFVQTLYFYDSILFCLSEDKENTKIGKLARATNSNSATVVRHPTTYIREGAIDGYQVEKIIKIAVKIIFVDIFHLKSVIEHLIN